MKTNSQIRQDTLAALKGHWGAAVFAILVFLLITMAISSPNSIYQIVKMAPSYWLFGGTTFVLVFVTYPLQIGLFNSYKLFIEKNDDDILPNMFKKGFGNYVHNLGGCLLMYVIILFATVLLIVPGLILGLAYFCVPYILVEEPDIKVADALTKSRIMMRGHKMDLFLIWLGMFGFFLLSLLTLGIALFWLVPYYYCVFGNFYLSVRNEFVQG